MKEEFWWEWFALDICATGTVDVSTDVLEGQTSLGFRDGRISKCEEFGSLPRGESVHLTLELLDSGRFEGFCFVETNHRENALVSIDVFCAGELRGPDVIRYLVEKCFPILK